MGLIGSRKDIFVTHVQPKAVRDAYTSYIPTYFLMKRSTPRESMEHSTLRSTLSFASPS
jgi:hypothetical protein